jgi:hypothetical protein
MTCPGLNLFVIGFKKDEAAVYQRGRGVFDALIKNPVMALL